MLNVLTRSKEMRDTTWREGCCTYYGGCRSKPDGDESNLSNDALQVAGQGFRPVESIADHTLGEREGYGATNALESLLHE